MANLICKIIDESNYKKFSPKSTLVEIAFGQDIDAFKYDAVKIEDEYFECHNDPTKVPKWVQIDVKESRQKTFIGKTAEFIECGKLENVKPYKLTNIVYY